MASGDIIVRVADKTTLDSCHTILGELKGLYDTGLTGKKLSEMEAPATPDNVVLGKTFYSENNVVKTGKLPLHAGANINYDNEEKVINPGSGIDTLYIPINRGAYTHASPDIMVTKKAIAEAVGLSGDTSDKIVEGNMILGVTGTAIKGKIVCMLQAYNFISHTGESTVTKKVVSYDGIYFNSSGNCIKDGTYNIASFAYSSKGGDASASTTILIGSDSYNSIAVKNKVSIASGTTTVCSAYAKGTGDGSNCKAVAILIISV